MSGPILPSVPMLSGSGSGKVFMVIAILGVLAMMASQKDAAATQGKAA